MPSEWEIKARAHRCARTGAPFGDGEPIYTLLFRERHGFTREDVSETAWQELKGTLKPFSFWRGEYRPRAPKPPEAVGREGVEGTLRRLLERDGQGLANARYVLALMLERKRVLRPVDVRENGGQRILIYEHVRTGEVFPIADPGLSLADVENVQGEVVSWLTADAPGSPPLP